MQGLGISFKSLDTPSRHFTTKMLHGWLNTGHQREKLTKDPLSSLCPCCQAPDETFEHILRCNSEASETARKAALLTISKLDKRGSTTWRVLHQGIKNWLKDGEKMKTPSLDHYMMLPGQRILLETALTNQEKIGWHYALRGYLSTSWVDSEHIVNQQPHDGIRQTWLRTIIKNIWKFGKTMWTHRNSVLHSKTTPQKDLTESGVNAQIRSLYEQQHDFAALDQVIFDTPLEVMLTRPIRSKKHWVCLAQRYHPSTYDRKTGKQNLITSFFP